MLALAISLLLLAPEDGREWSAKHAVGLRIPASWTVVAKDDGERVFVVEGPRLGPGVPRVVLWNGGPASDKGIEAFTDELVARIRARPGWTVSTRTRRVVGSAPTIRIAVGFTEEDARGRGRFTVALLGGSFYVLEMSAAASHFPAAAFDRLEGSLAVATREERFGDLVVAAPAGWERQDDRLIGPALGVGPAVLRLWRDEGGLRGPDGAAAGPEVEFLGARRRTLLANREKGEDRPALRMRLVHGDWWSAMLLAPSETWYDVEPAALDVLRSARLPAPAPPPDR